MYVLFIRRSNFKEKLAIMDSYCRICGKEEFLKLIEKRERQIIQYLFPNQNFDSDKLVTCSTCRAMVLSKEKEYRNKKTGTRPKSNLSTILWDANGCCPKFDQYGKPIRETIASNRSLDGRFRNKNESQDDNEVSQLPLSSLALTSVHTEETEAISLPVSDVSSTTISSRTVRRSTREQPHVLECRLISNIISKEDTGLKMIQTLEMGRGIVTTKRFEKDDYVATYHGDLLIGKEANTRYANYKVEDGSYMYFFKYNGLNYCIDATSKDNETLARLINHTRQSPNLISKKKIIDGYPYIYFKAARSIEENEEIFYDYYDRDTPLDWLQK